MNAETGAEEGRFARVGSAVLWAVAGLTALGVAVRFASLGLQSYHHDEVITAARVIPGSFGEMLHQVRASESNPPLYYVLAWGWAKAFGTDEFGLRSLTALFGAATIPVAYFAGRELASSRAGLIAAALAAVSPMLIWYSQEARSYALLVFFCALSFVFFARALRTRAGRDLALWALFSALALCSHYFAVYAIGIEALWLLVALRERWRAVLPAVGAVALAGLALLPLVTSQVNPTHIGWIDHSPLSTRLWETCVSFLIGETGHVIAEPPRDHYATIPVVLIGIGLLLALTRGNGRERRGVAIGIAVGAGVILLAAATALAGKDYVVERNLLPALLPLMSAAAVGFGASGARRLGLVLAGVLCAYWLAFDIHVTNVPNLQRPDFRTLTEDIGEAHGPRAIVTWKLAADSVEFYLDDDSQRLYGGPQTLSEIAVVSKPAAGDSVRLPPAFRLVERVRLERLTLTRYVSRRPQTIWFNALRDLRTGFGRNAVVVDGLPKRIVVPRENLDGGPLAVAPNARGEG